MKLKPKLRLGLSQVWKVNTNGIIGLETYFDFAVLIDATNI